VVEVRPDGAELTTAQVAQRTGWHVRTVRRAFVRWLEDGWPRVRREHGVRGNPRGVLVVCLADLEQLLAGDRPADAAAA
jgi:hypothetical protein